MKLRIKLITVLVVVVVIVLIAVAAAVVWNLRHDEESSWITCEVPEGSFRCLVIGPHHHRRIELAPDQAERARMILRRLVNHENDPEIQSGPPDHGLKIAPSWMIDFESIDESAARRGVRHGPCVCQVMVYAESFVRIAEDEWLYPPDDLVAELVVIVESATESEESGDEN